MRKLFIWVVVVLCFAVAAKLGNAQYTATPVAPMQNAAPQQMQQMGQQTQQLGQALSNSGDTISGTLHRDAQVKGDPLGKGEAQSRNPMGTGKGLLQVCGPQKQSEDATLRSVERDYEQKIGAVCNAYIFGISQGIDYVAFLMESVDPGKKSHTYICIPDGTPADALKNTVLSFLQKNKLLFDDIDTPRLTSLALSESFPCPAGKPPQP